MCVCVCVCVCVCNFSTHLSFSIYLWLYLSLYLLVSPFISLQINLFCKKTWLFIWFYIFLYFTFWNEVFPSNLSYSLLSGRYTLKLATLVSKIWTPLLGSWQKHWVWHHLGRYGMLLHCTGTSRFLQIPLTARNYCISL